MRFSGIGDSSTFQMLAEQVSRICAEYRKLRQRCVELERKVEKLSQSARRKKEPVASVDRAESTGEEAGSTFDKELLKAKVEEMLAELADIG